MFALVPRALFSFLVLCATASALYAEEWRLLAPGLELREFLVPDQVGDLAGQQGGMAVLRIDPDRYDLALGAALSTGQMRSMQDWARLSGFVAAINAGMFRSDDRLRSTGYMRDAGVLVSDFLHPGYGAFLAFQPREASLPRVRWVDRKLDPDWEAVLTAYDGIIQNYRLISRERENLWAQNDQRHSAAAIGMDASNRVLFIHCRPQVTLHEFAQALLDLPLDLIGAMYVEGGADAAMYVDVDGYVGRFVGEYQSDFFQGSNRNFWPAPNVLGIRPR
ncbi:phosphodiester glycosidase family protein [Desulfomicrobium salsuginis]